MVERAFIASALRRIGVRAVAAVSIRRKLLKEQRESASEAVVRESAWFGESKRVVFGSSREEPSRQEAIKT